ncbi:hypothetical protein PO909_016490 [Leuciscus waleckii]
MITVITESCSKSNYTDLAQILSLINISQPRELQTSQGLMQFSHPLNSRSKDLTPTEFALAFSIYRDIIFSVYPDRRTELDDYLSVILDMAVRFGGTGFYNYHVLFATQVAGQLQQFNQGTYWGTLDAELYCWIFAARTSMSCELCGAPSHPASACTITPSQSQPSSRKTSVFNRLSTAAPPPPLIPKPLNIQPTANVPLPKGIDKRGRPILYQGGRMLLINILMAKKFRILAPESDMPDNARQCQTISHSHVSMLIRGLRKQEPVLNIKHLPLTSDLLSQCIHTLRSGYLSPSIDQSLECMFFLAFFGFLRCSEFAPSTSAFNPAIHPSLSDITAHTPDSLIYNLKRSKTDQFGESFPIYIFRLRSFVSPYEPLSEYVSSRYANHSSPQFTLPHGKQENGHEILVLQTLPKYSQDLRHISRTLLYTFIPDRSSHHGRQHGHLGRDNQS